MSYRVVVTPEAEHDLEGLFLTIARDNPIAARKFVAGLRKRMGTLASMPERCPRAPEDGLHGLEIRQLLHGHYRILFHIRDRLVVVLRVRHGARRPAV
jgi:plasmid stabilization system protein ParE